VQQLQAGLEGPAQRERQPNHVQHLTAWQQQLTNNALFMQLQTIKSSVTRVSSKSVHAAEGPVKHETWHGSQLAEGYLRWHVQFFNSHGTGYTAATESPMSYFIANVRLYHDRDHVISREHSTPHLKPAGVHSVHDTQPQPTTAAALLMC
jgi:hypothetical protein